MTRILHDSDTHTNIMAKTYDGESIVDLERDVGEAMQGDYNDIINLLPKDDHGFIKGKIHVTVEWYDDPKCCVCGTRENLHKDGWYGYRCNSTDCVPF